MSEDKFMVVWNGSTCSYSVFSFVNGRMGERLEVGFPTLADAEDWALEKDEVK